MRTLLLTEDQVEQEYGVPKRTLQQHRFSRIGVPYVRVEGRIYYLRSDIDAYLEANRQSTSEESLTMPA